MKKFRLLPLLLCLTLVMCSCSFTKSTTSQPDGGTDQSELPMDDTPIVSDDTPLAAGFAESREELLSVLTGTASLRYGSYPGGDADPDGSVTVISANSSFADEHAQPKRTAYSDGLIYLVRGGSLFIYMTADGGAELLSETPLFTESYSEGGENDDPNHYAYGSESAEGVYLSGGRAAVVTSAYHYSEDFDEENGQWQYDEGQSVNIISLDVSSPDAPAVISRRSVDGTFCGAYTDSGRVFVVTSVFVKALNSDAPESYIPSISRGEDHELLSPEDIVILPENTCSGYTVIAGFDVSAGEITAVRAVLGGLGRLYMDSGAAYMIFSCSSLRESQSYQQSIYTVVDFSESTSSQIVRFALDDSLAMDSIYVDGCPGSNFSFAVSDGSLLLGTVHIESGYGIYTDPEKGWSNREDHEASCENLIYTVSPDFSAADASPFLPGSTVVSLKFFGETAYAETGDGLFAVPISGGSASLPEHPLPERLYSFGDNLFVGISDDMSISVIDSADMSVLSSAPVSDGNAAAFSASELCALPEYGLIAVPSGGTFRIFTYANGVLSAAAAVPYSGMQSDCALFCSGSAVYAVSDTVVTLSYPGFEELSSLELISPEIPGQLG